MNMNTETPVESSGSRLSDEAMRRMHRNWMRKYDHEYADEEEEERRFRIFKETFEEIEKRNTEEETCLFLLSPYSDRTDAEFFALYSDIDIQRRWPKEMRGDYFLRKSRRHVECEGCKIWAQYVELEEELEKKKQQLEEELEKKKQQLEEEEEEESEKKKQQLEEEFEKKKQQLEEEFEKKKEQLEEEEEEEESEKKKQHISDEV